MALYSVYVRSGTSGSGHLTHDKVRLFKLGFSWLAFAFPVIWLMFNRVWRWFLAILALEIGIAALVEQFGLPDWSLLLSSLAVMAYVGIAGRDWLGAALERRGFKPMATVSGEDEDEAYAAYIRRPKLRSSTMAAAKPEKSTETNAVIGLFPDPEARF